MQSFLLLPNQSLCVLPHTSDLVVKRITLQPLKAVKSSEDRRKAFGVTQGKGNKVFNSGREKGN